MGESSSSSWSSLLDTLSVISPPIYAEQQASANSPQLFSITSSGLYGVLWGAQGRLVVMEIERSRVIEVLVPISPDQWKNIHRIEINAVGSAVLLSGPNLCLVVNLPLNRTTKRYEAEPYASNRFVVKLNDGSIKVMELPVSSSQSDSSSQIVQARTVLQARKVPFKSISQELYQGTVVEVGYFNEEDAPVVELCKWHPLSECHVVVLSSTGTLSLFNATSDMEDSEQTHVVNSSSNNGVPKCFAFGSSSSEGWNKFTVYVGFSNGDVSALCPIVPNGLRVYRSEIDDLKAMVDAKIQLCKQESTTSTVHSRRNLKLRMLNAQKYWLDEVWLPDKQTQLSKKLNSSGSTSKVRFTAPDLDDDSGDDEVTSSPVYDTVFMVSMINILQGGWPVAVQGPFDISPSSSSSAANNTSSVVSIECNTPSCNDVPVISRMLSSSGHLELLELTRSINPMWQSADRSSEKDRPMATLVDSMALGINTETGGQPFLTRDPVNSDLLYVFHSSGVHLINLLSGTATVRHLFSVSPVREVSAVGVAGAAVVHQVLMGHILLVRLASGSFELVNVSSNTSQLQTPSKLRLEEEDDDEENTQLLCGAHEPFSEVCQKIFDSREPGVVRVSGSTRLGDVDDATVEFLIENISSLQKSEVKFVSTLRNEISARQKIHATALETQTTELKKLRTSMDEAKKSALTVSQKYNDIMALSDNLKKRAAAILQAVKENQPFISKAETAYHEKLQNMQSSLLRLNPKVSELKLKARKALQGTHSELAKVPGSSILSEEETIPSDRKKLYRDILDAEQILLQESRTIIQDVSTSLSKLKV